MKEPTTTIRLSRAIECDGRTAHSVVFMGAPGDEALPVSQRGDDFEIDALVVQTIIAQRTGLSRPAVERLAPIDFTTIALALFLPMRRKSKK